MLLLRENLDECSLASLVGFHGFSFGVIRTLNLKLRLSGWRSIVERAVLILVVMLVSSFQRLTCWFRTLQRATRPGWSYGSPQSASPSRDQQVHLRVRDTERVLQCQVLRCQERATRNFVIDQGESGLSETMVCEAHAAALKAGERYVYNSVDNVIYMGQDTLPQSK